ncbi:adenylate kinase family protein [Methanolobus halotolerans]|uniref:Putative adenylate kinase n=1 Tax=Methanolobus halotolerans TaxID=2052935 RepID=A0A4E0Q835_9EURY|nr:adenylate kinase family protein [Methanolobus halotolerans]TGC11070.1 adenylate kinase [Methanolobus halotolerans]
MLVGITGTPGTGKTAVTRLLERKRQYHIIHLNELIRKEGLYSEVDQERDCVVADMDVVEKRVKELISNSYPVTLLDSHLSHYIADNVIVLRTNPYTLRERLAKRGYSVEKIEENLDAEALDVILVESVEWCERVFEIDTTDMSVEETVAIVDDIVEGLLKDGEQEMHLRYKPGSVDWSEAFFD